MPRLTRQRRMNRDPPTDSPPDVPGSPVAPSPFSCGPNTDVECGKRASQKKQLNAPQQPGCASESGNP